MSPIAYPGLPVSQQVPVRPAVSDPFTGEEVSSRSATVAGLLQVFLGGFGAGRFYTGHVAMAIAQIAVAWMVLGAFVCAGVVLFVPFLFAWLGFLWPLTDGIILLTGARQRDADGRLLRP
jgi:TM2 domain-containing membrane protein YozV